MNLPIFSPSYPPDVPGPWSVVRLSEVSAADIVTRIGLPGNEHDSTFVVYQAMRWDENHGTTPVDPPEPNEPVAQWDWVQRAALALLPAKLLPATVLQRVFDTADGLWEEARRRGWEK